MTAELHTRQIAVRDDLTVTVAEAGEGRPALVLHGGGGPQTTQPIAAHLAASMRTLAPTHPGWNGTPRPESVSSISELAEAYLRLLAAEDLRDVLVVGNSIGGWIAMEMSVADSEGRVGSLVIIDSAGITVQGEEMPDFFALSPREIADHAFYDGDRFFVDPADLDESARAVTAGNMASLRVLAGDPYMHDPGLRARLRSVPVPVLVVWGEADRVFTPGYGRALAESFPAARFELIERAGHMPQLERPDALFALIDDFAAEVTA